MTKYIEAQKLIDRLMPMIEAINKQDLPEQQAWQTGYNNGIVAAQEEAADMPAADVVAQSTVDQIRWERDLALSQLESIGKGLGSKMDDVAVVKRGRWEPFDLTWGRSVYACTACGDAFEVPTEWGKPMYKFCPNCGASMDEEVEGFED